MRSLALVACLLLSPRVAAQEPAAVWPYPPLTSGPPPAEVVPPGLPERPACDPPPNGQQHWFALNLTTLQPFTGRVQFKVLPRENNSVWLEAYAGSVLFDGMYGFGARVNRAARTWGRGDALMCSPGLGVHIIPSGGFWGRRHSTLFYLAADVDVSWLHDFSPHFGFEVGVKAGIAGRVGGSWGGSARPDAVMFGRDFYPILSVYSGFRF
jgi:hypothetical protein